MLRRLLALAPVLAAALACEPRSVEPTRAFAAPGAMEIDLPAAAVAEHGPGASTFTLDPAARAPRWIEIAARDLGTPAAALRLEERSGGSGGTEFELRGALRRCGAVVEVTCAEQTEMGRPSFDWCRRALASLRCRLSRD
jgi:hypothetical protein